MLKKHYLIFSLVFLVLGCDSTSNDHTDFEAASEELVSCGATGFINPTSTTYNWEQVGDAIYGTPPPAGSDDYDRVRLVGLGVGISSDGTQVVSSIGNEIRSYSLSELGLVKSDPDLSSSGFYHKGQLDLSGNGSTLLLGSENISAKLLTRSTSGEWTAVGNYHEPEKGLGSMATSANGRLIAMSFYDQFGVGEIRTYTLLDNGSWQQLDLIIGQQGESVGGNVLLSNDGLTMIAGSGYDEISVYKLVDSQWVHQIFNTTEYAFSPHDPNIESPSTTSAWKGHIYNMAVSGDGNVLAVGYVSTTFRTTKDFTVRLYRIEDESIYQIGQTLEAAHRHDSFGKGLDLNCDGSIVTIGADTKWTAEGEPAYVRSFANVEDVWQQIGDDITFDYAGLGDLSISSDGETLVVGQVNDYFDYVRAQNFYGELKVFKLVQPDLKQ